MKKIDISEIDYSLTYEGYIWYSNKQKPEIIKGNLFTKAIFTSLPFIVEGNFYNDSTGCSISISHIDGFYIVRQASLKGLPETQIKEQEYIAHDLEDISKIKILQYWEEGQHDELLAGMTTLIPTWQAFKGFIK